MIETIFGIIAIIAAFIALISLIAGVEYNSRYPKKKYKKKTDIAFNIFIVSIIVIIICGPISFGILIST